MSSRVEVHMVRTAFLSQGMVRIFQYQQDPISPYPPSHLQKLLSFVASPPRPSEP